MRNISLFLTIIAILALATPASAAGTFKQVTLSQFIERWDVAAAREAQDLGIDPIYKILGAEQQENETVLKLANETLTVKVTVQQGKVSKFTVTHFFKEDQNILGFLSVSDIALEAFTPFWKVEQRENFMEKQMRQGEWIQRKAEVFTGKESKWSATYACMPHYKSMIESFGASINNAKW